jgi:lysophospholipase L1-like esterase
MKHGAVPVFLTYPVGTPFGRQTVAFANEHGIASIDVETEFATKVGQARTIAMRSSDGHVNDEGYRLMAEFVVDGLMRTPGWK